MKTLITVLLIMVIGCSTAPLVKQGAPQQQEILIRIEGVDTVQVEQDGDGIVRSMEVYNPEGKLSQLSFISGGKAFIKIFSGLSVADVTRLWNDFCVLEHSTTIRDVNIFINSPGGDAFSGLALADQIERAQNNGFNITAYASGIIASAAVPVLAVCDVRITAPGTIFMVHEAALWKWPGRETASDIQSQNELMVLLRDRYISKLVSNTKLSNKEWRVMEKKTTWFSSERAIEIGLVDRIE
jgi:ATP-dependent protease ClpP protease subunit